MLVAGFTCPRIARTATNQRKKINKKERKKEKEKSRRYDQSEWQIGFSNLFHSLVELYFRYLRK